MTTEKPILASLPDDENLTPPMWSGDRCGCTVWDAEGEAQPCDRPATGWRWYQGHGHEDALDVACELHSNEGGRRLHAAEAEVERLDSIITGVATGDGHSCQIGLAKIVQCDDRGVTDAEARAERAESNARGQQAVIEAQLATLDAHPAALAKAWDEGHRHSWRRGPDGCQCAAWSAIECACGEYGCGPLLSLADNPYRLDANPAPEADTTGGESGE